MAERHCQTAADLDGDHDSHSAHRWTTLPLCSVARLESDSVVPPHGSPSSAPTDQSLKMKCRRSADVKLASQEKLTQKRFYTNLQVFSCLQTAIHQVFQ